MKRQLKKRLAVALHLLPIIGLFVMLGCGSGSGMGCGKVECGEATHEKDGECVPKDKG